MKLQHSWMLIAGVLALTIAGRAPAIADSPTPARVSTLSVSGNGRIVLTPDRAVVTFGITTTNDAAAVATSQNNAIANALTNKLNQLGITGTAIKTSGYAIENNPRPAKPDPAVADRYGYTVNRTISVNVDKVDSVGTVLDAGVAAGVTNVQGVAFGLRDQRAAVRKAEAAAFLDAESQARDLAAVAHLRLGRILHLSPSGQSPQPLSRFAAAPMMSAAKSVPTTIDPGDLTINANVSVEYALLP